jgi:hypothetical protein
VVCATHLVWIFLDHSGWFAKMGDPVRILLRSNFVVFLLCTFVYAAPSDGECAGEPPLNNNESAGFLIHGIFARVGTSSIA